LSPSPDKLRCSWPGDEPLYVSYHDEEWGVPLYDSKQLFEKLALDGFQAGLSWITVLRKREAFRRAFDGFDPERVARYGEDKVLALLADPGIIRHRGKIEATIGNARAWLSIMDGGEDAFSELLWGFVGHRMQVNRRRRLEDLPASTDASKAMAKALKKRGFRFVGPTICYAFMQAVGMVNDHVVDCFRHAECVALARTSD
jgi:DNA-3-methyladenine glycosylase I